MRKRKSLVRRFICFCVLGLVAWTLWPFVYPDVSKLKTENPGKTAFMQFREREWKREGKKHRIKQIWVSYRNISPYAIRAVIIAEDGKFWSHDGFDFEAMQEAMQKNLRVKRIKVGGSTISQQLAKNLYLSPSRNPIRKIREAILTWRLERALSKRRILEIYLNVAEWGDGGIFGIEAAARHYYGKPASGLSAIESARLAAILPNPRRYHPVRASRYVRHRSAVIYRVMAQREIVSP